MNRNFTLEYWRDEEWFVGRLKEFPAVMSQGETLDDLVENIRDAYELLMADAASATEVPLRHEEMAITL